MREIAEFEWQSISYWETNLWNIEYSIEYRIKELKQKIVNQTITEEEKEELNLLK